MATSIEVNKFELRLLVGNVIDMMRARILITVG